MLADGHYVDGSWLLTVHIDALDIEQKIRVQGDWSVAEVIFQLTDGLKAPLFKPPKASEISLRTGTQKNGWSDYGLWWPNRRKWLLQNHASLNQYGLQADALLRLVPLYGNLRIQLPDLQFRDFVDVNYSDPIFRITVAICRQLSIRHPEELSLAHPISQWDLKRTRFVGGVTDHRRQAVSPSRMSSTFQRSATVGHGQTRRLSEQVLSTDGMKHDGFNGTIPSKSQMVNGDCRRSSQSSADRLFGPPCVHDRRPTSRISTSWSHLAKHQTLLSMNFTPASLHNLAFEFRSLGDPTLSSSPPLNMEEACANNQVVNPANFIQRLRLHTTWLDSSRSLMELGIDVRSGYHKATDLVAPLQETEKVPTLRLLYKYGTYYDLNPKYDAVRINQLYEQAKWSVLSELIETTDDEACLLAALQVHVEIATEREQHERNFPSSQATSQNGIDGLDASEVVQPANNKRPSPSARLPRDVSPIGGYLRHNQNPRLTNEPTRPLSVAELDAEIDAILVELDHADVDDIISLGGRRRHSRPRMRAIRPLSYLSTTSFTDELDAGPPQLSTYMKVCKPRKFGLKVFSNYFVTTDGLKLLVYKTEDDYKGKTEAVETIYLPGCDVQPDLAVPAKPFNIRILVPISRTNLPLSAAFNMNAFGEAQGQDAELSIGGRLRRRASLLSLTSLSQFGHTFGAQPTGNEVTSSGGLSGPAAAVLGLVNEIVFRPADGDAYADWLAYFRLASAMPGFGGQFGEEQVDWDGTVPRSHWVSMFTRSTFDAERRAILGLIRLLSSKTVDGISDSVDHSLRTNSLQDRLENRLSDFIPMKLSNSKHLIRTKDPRMRDTNDANLNKSTTLPTSSQRLPMHLGGGGSALTSNAQTKLIRRICQTYPQIVELSSLQTKLKYISAWEQLPQHGIAAFPARIEVTLSRSSLFPEDPDNPQTKRTGGVPWLSGGGNVTVFSSRRLEVVGIGPTRVLRCDLQTGEIMASWRLSSIQQWHINWELGELVLLLAAPSSPSKSRLERQRSVSPIEQLPSVAGRVIIRPEGVSVRTVAEFLGGYIFLNLRSPEKNQGLDEGVFYRLTTGSTLPVAYEISSRV